MADHKYKVMTETLWDCAYIPAFARLLIKYPRLKNIYYGWGDGANTDKPSTPPDDPMNVLTNVWKTINYMKPGTYMIAARNERILNIYYRRWLKNNQWKLLESGVMFGDTPYHIMRKD
jgi:hypothetical protein